MVRNFQSRPVPEEKVRRILDLALHAPSAGFSQGCAYVIVQNPITRQKIGNIQGEDNFYAMRFHKFVSGAPVLIVACTSEHLYHERYREPDKLREDGNEIEWPVPFWHFDVGCACMLIFLAAVNEGLTAAFTGVYHANEMRELLEIPAIYHPVGVISIGYPDRDVKSQSLRRGRKPLTQVIHHERW